MTTEKKVEEVCKAPKRCNYNYFGKCGSERDCVYKKKTEVKKWRTMEKTAAKI